MPQCFAAAMVVKVVSSERFDSEVLLGMRRLFEERIQMETPTMSLCLGSTLSMGQ